MIKTCTKCNLEKSLAGFRRDKTRKDGYRSECKACARLLHKQRYTEEYFESARKRNRKRSEANSLLIEAAKQAGCKLCPEKEHCCLEFHHIDPTNKNFIVSKGRNRTPKQLAAEIEKCVVICSNCHKKLHAGVVSF